MNKSKILSYLFSINAIKIDPNNLVTLSSGVKSPIYVNNRLITSYPDVREYIYNEMVNLLLDTFDEPDIIAGVSTGGISHGYAISNELRLPFIYVRSEPKSYGLNKQIEGEISPGKSVVVVEDTIFSGESSLKASKILKDSGLDVKGIISIFSYNDSFISLVNFEDIINSGKLSLENIKLLKEWKSKI